MRMTFRHGNWVRAKSGTYKGDLALIWKPGDVSEINGKLSILVVPRLGAPGESATKRFNTTQLPVVGEKRKRAFARFPPLPVTPLLVKQANDLGDTRYAHHNLLQGLLITQIKCNAVVRTLPQFHELQAFSEAGLNIRAWRKLLSQQTLRRGDRVIVIGGAENGIIGTYWSSHFTTATILPNVSEMNNADDVDAEARVLDVDLGQLERHFCIGDRVKRICTSAGAQELLGRVVQVVDKDSQDHTKEREARRKAMYEAFKEEDEGNVDVRQNPPSLAPDSCQIAYQPRHIDVTIVLDGTMEHVCIDAFALRNIR